MIDASYKVSEPLGVGVELIARVLFVCAQNVCRSPVMAAAFADAVTRGRPQDRDWVVRSAGTHARKAQMVCAVAVGTVPAAEGHLSVSVDREDLMLADLVITASRAERSWIAQQVPESRPSTFTLREALMLDERVGEAGPLGTIEEYVAALHAHRGTIELPASPSVRWRRAPADPLDFPDVHGARRGEHRRGLAEVAKAATALGYRMRDALLVPA